MTDNPKIELRSARDGELESFVEKHTGAGPFKWVPLGLTKTEWVKKLNGGRHPNTRDKDKRWPLEQGVLVHYEGKGVYRIGMCGNFYYGERLPDGRVDTSNSDFTKHNREDVVIVEYADTEAFDERLSRDTDGAIIYPPPDDPYWDW